ncbi:MAG: bacterial transcriptional activator domain-containing protein [Acidimicrobiales bacterium]
MGDLRVRLLGGLLVEGYRASELGSRKARSLLAALAVAGGAPVSVDGLAEVLWGDDLPARPADQVGVLVSRLRGTLGADRITRHDAGYALVVDWLDLREMEEGIAAAEASVAAGDALSARLAATMALDHVRGPLVPEEVAPWFEPHRMAVERRVAATRLLAAEAALVSGDPAGAAALAAKGLDHDPYDEAALRCVMRAHVAIGRPASALAAYAAVRARLADDLGVAPSADTEQLHGEILRAEPDPGVASPAVPERWDPLVQRARAELAATDFDAARRDADAAVQRGAGASALEVAGWVAYYDRDFEGALRLVGEAARVAGDDERRASALTLAGRARHSRGDLAGAERDLEVAVLSAVPGVRGTGEVWLSALRMHQGRFEEAIELSERGAVDAAALRHPFVIPHAMWARVYSLGALGQVTRALDALASLDVVVEDLGPAGDRYRPVLDNFWGWVLGATGRTDEAHDRHRRAADQAGRFTEPLHHALFDLALAAIEADDHATARVWLDQVEVPPDDAGAMAWHQRQRQHLLTARVALLEGDPASAAQLAAWVRADAEGRGAKRTVAQAEVVQHLSAGSTAAAAEVDRTIAALDGLARLEAWRLVGRLAAATERAELWAMAQRYADRLAAACGAASREAPAASRRFW